MIDSERITLKFNMKDEREKAVAEWLQQIKRGKGHVITNILYPMISGTTPIMPTISVGAVAAKGELHDQGDMTGITSTRDEEKVRKDTSEVESQKEEPLNSDIRDFNVDVPNRSTILKGLAAFGNMD